MDRLINYIKLTFWVIAFFILLLIFFTGAEQTIRLMRKNLHIYFSGLDEFISTCIGFALMGYWYNLADRNTKLINLVYKINERYKISQQLSKEKESEKISGYEFFDIVGMDMDINKAIERRNKSLWWYNLGKRNYKW